MSRGTVRWYDKDKGFGFIIPDEGGRDLYVQSANIDATEHELANYQRVEYEVTVGRKGPEAINVHPV